MREIKFRAWDKANGKWFTEWENPNRSDWTPNDGHKELSMTSGDGSIILEQFTGLLDANGKEIYEGDICRFDLQDFNGGDHFYTLPVAYTVDMYGFPYKSEPSEPEPDCCISLGEAVANDDELEIIGNIHENPGLLK